MGTNNKARRAAKARKRAQRGASSPGGQRTHSGSEAGWFGPPFGTPGGPPPRPSERERVMGLWAETMRAAEEAPHRVPGLVARLGQHSAAMVDEVAEFFLADLVGALWSHGWQPAELRRHLRSRTSAAAGRLAELVILADHEGRPGHRLDPRWAAQLEQFEQRTVSLRGGWIAGWRGREGLSMADGCHAVLEASTTLVRLPPLDVLIPPPGAPDSVVTLGAPARAGSGHPMLERIRKLLAKAEATEFEEEAASFTAKAQTLMTRHAIDEALVHAEEDRDAPRMVRLPIDAPYADAKSVLLARVAEANRCRSVYLTGLDLGSVIGHAEDLAVVELLFTSLLVQAQKALVEAGRGAVGRRARQQSFRASFFVAYAERIGERLSAASQEVLSEQGSSAALPVLRARADAVEEFVDGHYGAMLTAGRVRGGYDHAGQLYGRQAADDARLDSGAIAG